MRPRRIASPGRLLVVGMGLMANADARTHRLPARRAARFRDGLMIAFLAARPLRRRNFAGLEIGRHLLGSAASYRINLDGHETKSHRPYEASLPEPLSLMLERYLTVYRPVLLGTQQSTRLWITTKGRPMRDDSIHLRLREVLRRELGVPVNLHLFRDACATALAVDDPGHVRAAAPLLGHAGLATTERHYNLARMEDAARRYQRSLLELRRMLALVV